MERNFDSLKYADERDRSYGATGMAISLMVFDGEDLFASISLEGDPNDTISMLPEFYFSGNPGVSATAAWRQMVKNYNIGMGMLMGNVLCRRFVGAQTDVPPEVIGLLRSIASDEGTESCSLEADEIKRLFDKNFSYLQRVFSHRGVQAVAHDFASYLQAHRTISRLEALEQLASLRML